MGLEQDSALPKKVLLCADVRTAPLCLGSISTSLGNNRDYTVTQFMQLEELNQAIDSDSLNLAVLCIANKDGIVPAVSFLATRAPEIAAGRLRVLIFNRIDHPKVLTLLRAKGCGEVLSYSTTARAFAHKIQQSFLLLVKLAQAKRDEGISASDQKRSGSRNEALVRPDAESEIQWIEPAQVESDCWLIAKRRNIRNVMGKWLLEMVGPGPSAGSWEKATLPGAEKKQAWEWQPRDKVADPFVGNKGSWFFVGRLPEFDWKANQWRFVGEFPELAFYEGSEKMGFRFQASPGAPFRFRQNSEIAQAKLPQIRKTIDVSLTLQQEKKQAETELSIGLDLIDWGGTDIQRQKLASSGRGIGLGEGGPKVYGYDENTPEDAQGWETAEGAFESMQIQVSIVEKPDLEIQIAEYGEEGKVLLDVPEGEFHPGQKRDLRFQAKAGEALEEFRARVAVQSVEQPVFGRCVTIAMVDPAAAPRLREIFRAYEKRQAAVVEFLKQVKGH